MPDINNAIATITPFIMKWEGLGSKVAGVDNAYSFSASQNLDPNTVLFAYSDSGGVKTIGWGTTNYNVIDSGPVKANDSITKAQADTELAYEINQKANQLLQYGLPDGCTDLQFAALISLAYNAGIGSAESMIDYINNSSSQDDVVSYWKTFHLKDRSGNTLSGLINRRKDEIDMYTGKYNEIYSFYLRNAANINYAIVGGLIIGITLSTLVLYKKGKLNLK